MTFTGQNYGARQPERIRKIIRTGLGMHLGFSALFSLTLFLTRYLTVRCFTDDPAVIAEGVTIICMLAFSTRSSAAWRSSPPPCAAAATASCRRS